MSEGVFGDFRFVDGEEVDADVLERLAGVLTGDEGLRSRLILFGLEVSCLTTLLESWALVAFLALRRGVSVLA